jgi:L-lactate dehydrogenase
VYREIVPAVVEVAPGALLVAVTDPPDPLADLTRALAGHERVISTGTVIDSLRFRVHVGAQLSVDPRSVDALVVGEHGTSQVMLWSSVSIQGTPLADALGACCPNPSLAEVREQVEREVRYANIEIIEGNDASQFGIGAVCARITEAAVRDEGVVMPVAAYRERYGVTIALPSVLGREGVRADLEPGMSDEERAAFERSVETLRDAARGVGAASPPSTAEAAPGPVRGKPAGP